MNDSISKELVQTNKETSKEDDVFHTHVSLVLSKPIHQTLGRKFPQQAQNRKQPFTFLITPIQSSFKVLDSLIIVHLQIYIRLQNANIVIDFGHMEDQCFHVHPYK